MNLYSTISLIGSAGAFLAGLVVLLKNYRVLVNRIFFLFSTAVAAWLCFAGFMTASCGNTELAILLDRLVYLSVISIVPTVYHFTVIFSKKTSQKFLIIPAYALATVFGVLAFSENFLFGLIYYPVGCHTQAGYFHHAFLVYFMSFIVLMYVNLFSKLKDSAGEERVQIKFILLSFCVLGLGALGFLPAYGIYIPLYINISGVASVVILAYAIVRHHLLNIKVIAVEALSFFTVIILLVDSLLSKSKIEFALKFSLVLAIAFFSYLLIRGVMKEIKDKERIAGISNELKDANTELKRLDRAKSEFLSIASHQLRTPLTAIKGYSSMLLDNDYGEMPKESKKIIEKIFLSSKRLTMIVDDFLDVSRIEAGEMRYDIHKFNLKETVKNIVDDFVTNNPKARDLNLQFSWEDKNYTIQNDQNKIAQIISNIIDNSIKYTPKGHIKVYLSRNEEENKFLIKVEDTGVGISKETLARLFQKFTRAQEISKLHTDGSGLGLYVAKRIIEDLHGKIRAESAGEGKGSAFFIELPVS